MKGMERRFVTIGSILAFLAVGLGAFGAHALRDRLSPSSLEIWHTAVQYHLAHALALVLVGALAQTMTGKWLRAAGWLFTTGIVVFGGSLYLLALSDMRILGAITPLGGVAFLAGWVCLAVAAAKG